MAFVILERGKCAWGACYFCGWGKKKVNSRIEDLKRKFLRALEKDEKKDVVKIFSSGSFLDENQFPTEFVKWVIKAAKEHGYKEIVIESLPQFITEEKLKEISVPGIKVTVAIGLEVADDEIRLKYYKKGFTTEEFLKAVELLKKYGFGLRVYLLVNGHPYLFEHPELQKKLIRESVQFAEKYADSIVVINALPHPGAPLFRDYLAGRWRPLTREEFYEVIGDLKDHEKVEIDESNFYFVPKIPKEMQEFIKGVGRDVLLHPHFRIWQEYLYLYYQVPKIKRVALFLPCSYRKPYYKSRTHRKILGVLKPKEYYKQLHIIVVSTPGVVPYEFVSYYPFTSYDWPEWEETEEVKRDYIEITKERVKKYLEKHADSYDYFVAYFHRNSETLEAIRQAFKDLGMEDRLIEVIDEETWQKILEATGREKISASAVRHEIALKKLEETLDKLFEEIKRKEEKEEAREPAKITS